MDFNRSAAEKTAAFTLYRANSNGTPVFMDSPHSGRDYSLFNGYMDIDETLSAFSEDRWVDFLLSDMPAEGVDVLLANFPRDLIDPNRSPRQISKEQFIDLDTNKYKTRPNDNHVRAGLGLIADNIKDNQRVAHKIYNGKLPQSELERRLEDLYHPYHNRIADILAEKVATHGRCFHINCHSMQSWAAPKINGQPVDFEIGYQCNMTGNDTAFENLVAELTVFLQLQGFKIAVNRRFRGGHIISHHGKPQQGISSIQLEINRSLYMDENTLAYKPEQAERVKKALSGINSTIMAFHTSPQPAEEKTPHIPSYMRR